MMPNPTLSVKKICPAAASQVFDSPSLLQSGFHRKPRPLTTLFSGFAGFGAPSVSTRIVRKPARINSTGRAYMHTTSMPLLTPR